MNVVLRLIILLLVILSADIESARYLSNKIMSNTKIGALQTIRKGFLLFCIDCIICNLFLYIYNFNVYILLIYK